jgi:hypothetical protein
LGQKSSKNFETLLDLCVSSLRGGHANLLCIVLFFIKCPKASTIERTSYMNHNAMRASTSNNPPARSTKGMSTPLTMLLTAVLLTVDRVRSPVAERGEHATGPAVDIDGSAGEARGIAPCSHASVPCLTYFRKIVPVLRLVLRQRDEGRPALGVPTSAHPSHRTEAARFKAD